MSSFIPDKVNTICTFQMSPGPSMLILSRSKITVHHNASKQDKPLLNKDDRNILTPFQCRIPANAFISCLAFGAALVVGALLILSGPIGWGIMAVGAGFVALGAFQATQVSHQCTAGLSAGKWTYLHESVKLNGSAALIQQSFLICSKGGVLSPIFSFAIAQKYSEEIASNNRKEAGINGLASLISGLAIIELSVGLVGAEILVGVKEVAKFGLFSIVGISVVSVGTYAEKEVMRNNNLKDSHNYDRLNTDNTEKAPSYKGDVNTVKPEWMPTTEEPAARSFRPDDFADINDIVEVNEKGVITGVAKNINNIKLSNQLSQDLNSLKGIDKRDLWKNPKAKAIVENIRNNKYPDSMTAASVDGEGKVRYTRLLKVSADTMKVKAESMKEIGTAGKKAMNFAAFFLPIASTYFSEQARIELAKAMDEDLSEGISVVAFHPV